PGAFLTSEYPWTDVSGQPLGFAGCDQLPFSPGIGVKLEEHAASTPTGLEAVVKVPQDTTLEPGGLAEADLRDTTVTLPEGVKLSRSAANDLEACTEAEAGFEGVNPVSQSDEFNTLPIGCPDGAKLGNVKIKTPLLPHQLEGSVYLATPAPNGEAQRNPFNSL